jgi:PleD family two-component response regulator
MEKTVVLIEPTTIIRSRLKQSLSDLGLKVYEISEGGKALAARKFSPNATEPGILDMIIPDIIILSFDMEDVNPVRVLKAFKLDTDFKSVPVVVSSVRNDKDTIIAAISSGAADYVLKKDGFVNTLIDKVSKIFEKDQLTFEATLKREVDWVRYGKKELSLAMIMVRRYATGKPIDNDSFDKVLTTLKSKMRHYDWVFRLDDKRIAAILPVTTLKDVIILRDRLLELLNMLSEEIKLPMDIQIGFSHFPVNAKSAEELVVLADEQIQE